MKPDRASTRLGPNSGLGSAPHGLTLVEMLVSVVLTLLIVFAVVQAFDLLGDTITLNRASIEMAGPMRKASVQLQRDLDSVMGKIRPWIDPDAAGGYFEYYEGPGNDTADDRNFNGFDPVNDFFDTAVPTAYTGDYDDVWMATVQSTGTPFRGRSPNGSAESTMAEVVWWVARLDANSNLRIDPTDPLLLLRRLLLIRPPDGGLWTLNPTATAENFFRDFDISARLEYDAASSTWVPRLNSLSDLANRRNRFGHIVHRQNTAAGFPHEMALISEQLQPNPSQPLNATWKTAVEYSQKNTRNGVAPNATGFDPNAWSWSFLPRFVSLADLQQVASDWIVISDVAAFDVRAYDAYAPVFELANGGNIAIAPGDAGYRLDNEQYVAQFAPNWSHGAYVDLGYAPVLDSRIPLSM
ncbi:MAG TPA: hypothetical protein VIY86_11255, partial [Pirellulaceae bacterium]